MTERHRKAYVLTVDRRDFSADRRNDGKRSTSSRHQSLIGPARNACRSYAPRRTSGWCLDANRSPSKASAATRAGEAPGSSPLLAAGVGRALPVAVGGYRAAQLGRQLTGGQINGVAVSGRPEVDVRACRFQTAKQTSPNAVGGRLSRGPICRYAHRRTQRLVATMPDAHESTSPHRAAAVLADRWQHAWNGHDMQSAGELLAPDADFVNVGGRWLRGRSQFIDYHVE
jgi:hypothetical protein